MGTIKVLEEIVKLYQRKYDRVLSLQGGAASVEEMDNAKIQYLEALLRLEQAKENLS